MCGSGLRWTYIPTPQPNDAVIARVCARCGKRVRKPRVHITVRWEQWKDVRTESRATGEIAFVPITEMTDQRRQTRAIHTCCSRPENEREVLGKVIRNQWSRRRNGTPGKFFLIVEDQATGRRHWANLDTCRIVDPVTMLSKLVEDGGRTPA